MLPLGAPQEKTDASRRFPRDSALCRARRGLRAQAHVSSRDRPDHPLVSLLVALKPIDAARNQRLATETVHRPLQDRSVGQNVFALRTPGDATHESIVACAPRSAIPYVAFGAADAAPLPTLVARRMSVVAGEMALAASGMSLVGRPATLVASRISLVGREMSLVGSRSASVASPADTGGRPRDTGGRPRDTGGKGCCQW